MDTISEEDALVCQVLVSIPLVFQHRGTPDDLNFILSCTKMVVISRGASQSAQKLIVDVLAPLGRFKCGLMDIKDLHVEMQKRMSSTYNRINFNQCRKITSLFELKNLAVKLHDYMHNIARTPVSSLPPSAPSSPSSAPSPSLTPLPVSPRTINTKGKARRRLVYTRDSLLLLKDSLAPDLKLEHNLPQLISQSVWHPCGGGTTRSKGYQSNSSKCLPQHNRSVSSPSSPHNRSVTAPLTKPHRQSRTVPSIKPLPVHSQSNTSSSTKASSLPSTPSIKDSSPQSMPLSIKDSQSMPPPIKDLSMPMPPPINASSPQSMAPSIKDSTANGMSVYTPITPPLSPMTPPTTLPSPSESPSIGSPIPQYPPRPLPPAPHQHPRPLLNHCPRPLLHHPPRPLPPVYPRPLVDHCPRPFLDHPPRPLPPVSRGYPRPLVDHPPRPLPPVSHCYPRPLLDHSPRLFPHCHPKPFLDHAPEPLPPAPLSPLPDHPPGPLLLVPPRCCLTVIVPPPPIVYQIQSGSQSL